MWVKNTIVILLLHSLMFAYNDLGIYGQQYTIVEKNPMIAIKKAQNDLNKTKIIKDIYSSYNRYMNVDFNVPICKENKKRVLDPTVVLKYDIDMPKYKIHIKKGEKFNPLKYATSYSYLMFIDATDKMQLLFAKQYAKSSSIIITKGNIDKVLKEVPNSIGVYKTNKYIQKAFKLKCVPSVYIQNGDKFTVMEYKISQKERK